jgi:predicted  nucleic acid-binding Zn-ribbon protein
MTSIRTYVTILVQDLLNRLHQKLSRWLLGDVNALIETAHRDNMVRFKTLAQNAIGLEEHITALEKQFVANRTSIATAFARDKRLCALEDAAQKAKATAHGAALEFVEVKNRIEFLEKAPVKAAKPAPKRKPANR